jgi:hypothetical protein
VQALASVGVFAKDDHGRFGLTLADCLRSDAPGSPRATAIMPGEEHYAAYGELLYSVQTGRPAFENVFGEPVFDFLSRHPEQACLFDQARCGM